MEKVTGFGLVRRDAMRKAPTVNSKIVYALLATYADAKTREAWPKAETLAEELGISKRSVVYALAQLREAEVITLVRYMHDERGYRTGAVYRINDSQAHQDAVRKPKRHARRIGDAPNAPQRKSPSATGCVAEQTTLEHTTKNKKPKVIKATKVGDAKKKKGSSRLVPGTTVELNDLIRQFPEAGSEELLRHVLPSDHTLALKNLQKMGKNS